MTSISNPLEQLSPQARDIEAEKAEQKKKWLQRISKLFSREENSTLRRQQSPSTTTDANTAPTPLGKPKAGLRFSRQVIPGLPRPGTFRRQLSERRERLSPSELDHPDRRTLSVDRRRDFAARTLPPVTYMNPRTSAPAVYEIPDRHDPTTPVSLPQQQNMDAVMMQRPTDPPTPPPDEHAHIADDASRQDNDPTDIQADLQHRWILNLSMHFRDKSPREKFFVTYAETPTRWRRVTVSCDYRNALPDSLESDLRHLHYQRDKSARIYEAIRSSLPDIQFYDTVTNLRLETGSDERLHVHVTEDLNESIQYPDKHLLNHLNYENLKRVSESDVHFESHMSGFVYKVKVDGEVLIKKEIPGPDSVEEFLYEINALNALQGSQHVVQMRGLVLDESRTVVTGLLIDYYEQGPLVDVLFDYRNDLSWERRVKWATHIIQGLGEIHEAGFVQGDFTVSNICITKDDDARIIDINRRGCPVGWEPPEIARMIDSGQRISMYIGVKSDLFQLGMVLWALAMEDDEPERRHRPLHLPEDSSLRIPDWYRELTHLCLSPEPRCRPSANRLLALARQPSSLSLARTRRSSSAAASQRLNSQSDRLGHPVGQGLRENRSATMSPARDESPLGGRPRKTESRSISRSPSVDEPRRGRSPARNTAHLDQPQLDGSSTASRDIDGGNATEVEPEIVPIDPTGSDWRKVTFNGHEYVMHVDSPSPPPPLPATSGTGQASTSATEETIGQDVSGHGDRASSPAGIIETSDVARESGTELPPAPEVPRAPEPPVFMPSYERPDSDLAYMHLSPTNPPSPARHYWNHGAFSQQNYSMPGHDYGHGALGPFYHQDSGLGEMDLDADVLAGVGMNDNLNLDLGPGHASGRRRWTMKNTEDDVEATNDERSQVEPKPTQSGECSVKGLDEMDLSRSANGFDGSGAMNKNIGETQSERATEPGTSAKYPMNDQASTIVEKKI